MSNVAQINTSGSEAGEGSEVEKKDISTQWNAKTEKKIQELAETYDEVKDQRTKLNDRLKAAKTDLIADGFNGDAIDHAVKYYRLDEDKREGYDLTYQFFRKSLGVPVQDDLFVAALRNQAESHQEQKKEANKVDVFDEAPSTAGGETAEPGAGYVE